MGGKILAGLTAFVEFWEKNLLKNNKFIAFERKYPLFGRCEKQTARAAFDHTHNRRLDIFLLAVRSIFVLVFSKSEKIGRREFC